MAMATATERERSEPRSRGGDFITAPQLAAEFGVSVKALMGLVAAGRLPPPWASLSVKTRVWRRDHYEQFVATGKWPAESVKKKGGGK